MRLKIQAKGSGKDDCGAHGRSITARVTKGKPPNLDRNCQSLCAAHLVAGTPKNAVGDSQAIGAALSATYAIPLFRYAIL